MVATSVVKRKRECREKPKRMLDDKPPSTPLDSTGGFVEMRCNVSALNNLETQFKAANNV